MKPIRLKSPPRRQRGVVLLVALVVTVALTLAGIALMRSVDTTTAAVSNLGFRQGSLAPVNQVMERAVYALFDGALIPDKNADYVNENYYATLQPGETTNGIPAALQGIYPPTAYPGGFKIVPKDPNTKYEFRYVIERMCNAAGQPKLGTCEMSPPKQSLADQITERDDIKLGRVPFYRVTIRVDGPANTVTYAQAMLR